MLRNLARPALRATQRRCASTTTAASEVPLANLELRWKTLSATEQGSLAKQLEQLQAGDWAKMTLEQKKAGTRNKKDTEEKENSNEDFSISNTEPDTVRKSGGQSFARKLELIGKGREQGAFSDT